MHREQPIRRPGTDRCHSKASVAELPAVLLLVPILVFLLLTAHRAAARPAPARDTTATPRADTPIAKDEQTAPLPNAPHKPKPTWKLALSWSDSVGFDSNPTRVEPVSGLPTQPTAFAVGLLEVAGKTLWSGQHLSATAALGTKVHFADEARSADMWIARTDLTWAARAGVVDLALSGSYFESHEASTLQAEQTGAATSLPSSLSFRILTAQAQAIGSPAENVTVRAGLRATRFTYLPDDTLSYQAIAPFLRISVAFDLAKEKGAHLLTLSAQTAAAWNRYPYWPESRADLAPVLELQASYLGWCLAKLTYQLWANFSPDPSWSATRHSLSAGISAALPWKLFLVSEATFQYLDYATGLLLYTPSSSSNFARLDQEGRSSVLLSLQRTLTKRYSIQLRYLVYFDLTEPERAASRAGRYQRHLVTLDLQAALK